MSNTSTHTRSSKKFKNNSSKKLEDEEKEREKEREKDLNEEKEEILKKTLPDYLANDLDIMIIGINPGMTSARHGRHYSGVGNHFWKCLYHSRLIDKPLTAYDDHKLIKLHRIGFTNIVQRTTRSSNDLTRGEIKSGAEILKQKLQTYQPKIAVFNGKGIYQIFSGKSNFNLGLQPDMIEGTETKIFVMPSSSARCSNLPRASDKLPYYIGLKKLLDHLRGGQDVVDESDFVFPSLKSPKKPSLKSPKESSLNSPNKSKLGLKSPKESSLNPPNKSKLSLKSPKESSLNSPNKSKPT